MSSINNKSDLSRLFTLIEDSINTNTKQVTDFFAFNDDNSKNLRDASVQTYAQGQASSQIQNSYMKQKIVDSKASVEERKQKIIEKKKERERESGQKSIIETKALDQERSELKKEVSRGKLQEAIVWAEILGQPMCKRRHNRTSRYKSKF